MIYKYFNRLQAIRARELNVRGTRIHVPSQIDPHSTRLLREFVDLLNEIDVENGFSAKEYREYFEHMKKESPDFYTKLTTEYYVFYPELHRVDRLVETKL